MKNLMAYIPSILLIIGAMGLATSGTIGWGYFLVCAVILYPWPVF